MSDVLTAFPSTNKAELDLARQIQSTFVPGRCHGWPGVRLAARRLAGGCLGGDFHDVINGLDEQSLVAIGTIRGPGLVAALAKTVISGAVRKFGPITRSPQALIQRIDQLLGHLNADLREPRVSCSMFVGVVDRNRGILEYCSVGGCRPRVWTRDGKTKLLSLTGPALTGCSDVKYDRGSLKLRSLRRLIICSDGLTSAESPKGQVFGAVRERNLLRGATDLPADQQAGTILQAVCEHVGLDRVPNADVTVLVTDFCEAAVAPDSGAMSVRLGSYGGTVESPPDSSVFLG